MTTTTAGDTNTSVAAADTLRALADVVDAVGLPPLSIYTVDRTPAVHVHELQPWLDATGIDAPIAYTPDGHAMWAHDNGDWRPVSPTGRGGFCLRHVDLSRTQAGV